MNRITPGVKFFGFCKIHLIECAGSKIPVCPIPVWRDLTD